MMNRGVMHASISSHKKEQHPLYRVLFQMFESIEIQGISIDLLCA